MDQTPVLRRLINCPGLQVLLLLLLLLLVLLLLRKRKFRHVRSLLDYRGQTANGQMALHLFHGRRESL